VHGAPIGGGRSAARDPVLAAAVARSAAAARVRSSCVQDYGVLVSDPLQRLRDRLWERHATASEAFHAFVRQAFPSLSNRSLLTEICLCHACSCHEILRVEAAGQDTDRDGFVGRDDWVAGCTGASHSAARLLGDLAQLRCDGAAAARIFDGR
jgi:hypothetical protein